jgi:hypothetical protein
VFVAEHESSGKYNMEIDRKTINKNIDLYIANRGMPKLYFGKEKVVLVPELAHIGYCPKVPKETLEGCEEVQRTSLGLARFADGLIDHVWFCYHDDNPENRWLDRVCHSLLRMKYGKSSPDFDTLVEQMQMEEKDEKYNLANQPQLRNAMAFRYGLKILNSKLGQPEFLKYLGQLPSLRADLERIPQEIRNLDFEKMLSNYPGILDNHSRVNVPEMALPYRAG